MRIFLIGSYVTEATTFDIYAAFSKDIGRRLAEKSVELALCSPFQDSFDYHVVTGIQDCQQPKISLELFYPMDPTVENEWNRHIAGLDQGIKIRKYRQEATGIEIGDSRIYGWLFCQIQALSLADFVLVVGGKVGGSSNLLVRIADAQGKEVIPLPGFGGVGALQFEKTRYKLIDYWGNQTIQKLNVINDPREIVDIIVERPIDRNTGAIQQKKEGLSFFISYAQEAPAHADLVEMILRRRGYLVYRDEQNFSASEDIPNSVREYILKADVFIALWNKEYACSPWCFDELSMALGTHQKNGKSLWILRTDKTRMVPPKARNILYFDVETREEIEGRVLSLLLNSRQT